ncbi:rho-related GTP-binding protein RhoN-like isoform X2 [Takifugu rubripes]|uniref:rho-related GTP-binding protein RhoN-like isoform X2 n=1 Tax=Takifugu rubripes TaxID=31033 RepID=UPI001145A664|nr:rho-related GTP-binding protein RhoN-like isoform X2 [Takifugu rubripes]XP_056887798.1 rho-related GTP-binding protein RhoN-like isoform X2 [Takifugu flavidus]
MESNKGSLRCKIVVVGDTQCGKTALLHVFAKDSYPENYVPTVFENYTASFEIDKQRIELNMWDTSGSAYYDNVRPLAYPDADAVLICFDVSRPETLDSVTKKGTNLARQIGAVAYAECTSRYSENSVRDVFHVTTLASLSRIPHRPPLKRAGSRRGLKRVSQQPPRTEIHEHPPTVRKDRAKSCVLM